MPTTFYIDPQTDRKGSGLSPDAPARCLEELKPRSGDRVLFRRGCLIDRELALPCGEPGAPILCGAYGEGADPVIDTSIDAGSPACWETVRPSVWRYTGKLPSEVCNLVFDGGARCGKLRWSPEELDEPDEWHYTEIGMSSRPPEGRREPFNTGELYLYSAANPALSDKSLRICVWGSRRAVSAEHDVIFENFTLRNIGLHGFQSAHVKRVTIRNCRFENIGGAVWSRPLRIRFGNAVELWDGTSDCVIEHCLFRNIYDSGVTHQGVVSTSEQAERLWIRNNVFCECGLAAYEWRGPSSHDVHFENNLCMNAGGAFTLQGEPPPRRSESGLIGAVCVFVNLWRLETELPPDQVYCYIRGNVFCNAPAYGAAIASVLEPRCEKQFVIDRNTYCQSNGGPLIRMDGELFDAADFERYRSRTGKDLNSLLITDRPL